MTAFAVNNGYVGQEISGVHLDGKVVSIEQIRRAFRLCAFHAGGEYHGSPDGLDDIETLVKMVADHADLPGEPDEDSIGWLGDGSPLEMTFGHIRRAVAALDALKSSGTPHVCRSVRGYLFEMRYESDRWSGTMFSETINLPEGDVRNIVPLYAEIPS